ncbi:hypothetical protein L1049_026112 [Liquidambar formosana]|uniref:Uncharacterized protein n=1 Tax=Liquidambar formosana TaxID=63359 RepID=A0AAP0NEB8_LIQFO
MMQAPMDQNYHQIVASKFQNIQMLYSSTDSVASDRARTQDEQAETLANASYLDSVKECVGVEEQTEESCNGKIFLKCILEGSEKPPDFDDLSNFVECKRGKDYSCWLKDRQRFRKWKCEKMAVLRWQKWKKTWRSMKKRKV